jgi:hypothetical protein
VPHCAALVRGVLPALASPNENIAGAAVRANDALLALVRGADDLGTFLAPLLDALLEVCMCAHVHGIVMTWPARRRCLRQLVRRAAARTRRRGRAPSTARCRCVFVRSGTRDVFGVRLILLHFTRKTPVINYIERIHVAHGARQCAARARQSQQRVVDVVGCHRSRRCRQRECDGERQWHDECCC